MKCAYCNSEIKDGEFFCPACGKEVQMVPDYNVLEDDILPAFLEENKKKKSQTSGKNEAGNDASYTEDLKNKKKNNRKILLIVLLCLILGAAVGLGFYAHTHSYDYLFAKGQESYESEDYDTALSYYKQAKAKEETSRVLVQIGMCRFYQEEYTDALNYFQKVLAEDASNADAFLGVLMVYSQQQDYDTMASLSETDLTEEETSLLEQYLILPPVFSEEGGSFDDDVELTLTSSQGYDIYYTLDGSTPTAEDGTLYTDSITLEDGTTTVSAICVNSEGKEGSVVEETYKITYKKPGYVTLSPSGGTYSEPTTVTISTDVENARIYYTWDNTDPTASSAQYTEPIIIPEGNNVLSVIVIDSHGLSSDVLRANYRYMP